MEPATDKRLAFCTLGMLIIDEIDYGEGKDREENVLGGAGTYAALGARLAAGPQNAHLVSWIVDKGSDFPNEVAAVIESWGTNCVFRTDLNRLTTRAWNGYGPNQNRAFKYLTQKQRLEEHDLSDDQALSSSFHMVCSPSRCIDLWHNINHRRDKVPGSNPAILVWEPVPDLCTPVEFQNLKRAAERVRVVSPNAEEFSNFFVGQKPWPDRKGMIAQVLDRELGTGRLYPAFVIREGAEGSRLYLGEQEVHFPAYHWSNSQVIDPTGGGNTFLGALAIALTGNCFPTSGIFVKLKWNVTPRMSDEVMEFVCAVVHATIAASFAIEQVGTPKVEPEQPDVWNGVSYTGRLHEYLEREGAYLADQLCNSQPLGNGAGNGT